VVDDSFVQAAVTRRAVDRHVIDVERLDDVDHIVAAARRLIHRIGRRRHGFGRDLPRARQRRLGFAQRRSRHGAGRNGRCDRCGGADEAGALEEITTARISLLAALRHRYPPHERSAEFGAIMICSGLSRSAAQASS
jgi:hypothetical protein